MSKNSNITLTMSELKQIVPAIAQQKLPIMIRGRHGIGKSEFVYALAANPDITSIPSEVVEMRASQMTEGDLVGLPFRGDDVIVNDKAIGSTQWNPPDWFLTACSRPVCLFFDEVDRATTEVRQGLFQLNDSRQLNGHRLHPDTVVFACINGGMHGSSYQVQEMDPAELDRYTVFDLEPSPEEWLDWARTNTYPEVVAFIKEHTRFLDYKEAVFDPAAIYPSRRSWARYAKVLKSIYPEGISKDAKDISRVFVLGTGFVGKEAAMAFRGFIQEYTRKIDAYQIFMQGNFEGTETWATPDWVSLLEKAEDAKMFTPEIFATVPLTNIVKFVKAAPIEVFPVLFQNLLNVSVEFTGSFISGSYDDEASNEMAAWVFENLIVGFEEAKSHINTEEAA